MSAERLESLFPNLNRMGYTITSTADVDYNCVAWAVGDTRKWWELLPGLYWPPGAKKEYSLAVYLRVFAVHGYAPCDHAELEPGYDKVAIYIDADGIPSHAARQTTSGKWTSKIGELKDIEHDTLSALEGEAYGTVAQVMKRKSARSQE
ncbi:MAG: hypothetical protein ABI977_26745 [Acidobacteriota bacterium]